MVFFEFFIRAAGVTGLLVLCGIALRDARDIAAVRFGALTALAIASALTIHTAAGMAPPLQLRAFLLPISSSLIIFVWWFSRSLFDDEFKLGYLEWGVAAAWVFLGLINYADLVASSPVSVGWADLLRSIISYALVAHIVYVAISEKKVDLVEGRRRARIFFAASLLALYLLNKAGENIYGYHAMPLWFTSLLYGVLLVFVALCLFSAIGINKNSWIFDRQNIKAHAKPFDAPPDLDADAKALRQRLNQAMDVEQAFLEPGLSIGTLAARINASEHSLRALINRSLGHKNFRTFLNAYRLNAAKDALADKALAETPVTTIALDAGFASLASFNRFFKNATNQSPSAYRKSALSDGGDEKR